MAGDAAVLRWLAAEVRRLRRELDALKELKAFDAEKEKEEEADEGEERQTGAFKLDPEEEENKAATFKLDPAALDGEEEKKKTGTFKLDPAASPFTPGRLDEEERKEKKVTCKLDPAASPFTPSRLDEEENKKKKMVNFDFFELAAALGPRSVCGELGVGEEKREKHKPKSLEVCVREKLTTALEPTLSNLTCLEGRLAALEARGLGSLAEEPGGHEKHERCMDCGVGAPVARGCLSVALPAKVVPSLPAPSSMPTQVVPSFCCMHNRDEKRPTGEHRLRECTVCHVQFRTPYVDVALCMPCSEKHKRCMICGEHGERATSEGPLPDHSKPVCKKVAFGGKEVVVYDPLARQKEELKGLGGAKN